MCDPERALERVEVAAAILQNMIKDQEMYGLSAFDCGVVRTLLLGAADSMNASSSFPAK